ncbi:MAG: trigger factor [Gammaproteobacteria bacterium]
MQVSVESVSNLGRRMTVQVPAEEINQQVSSKLQQLAQTVKLDGFRPGKVPLSVVEKRFGEQARAEVSNDVISKTYEEALKQENLNPAGTPSIEPSENSDLFEYVASFEIYPEIVLPQISDLNIDKPVAEVAESDLDEMMEKLRKQRVTWSDVDRASANGDKLTIDFEGKINGEAFSGNSAKQVPLELGSGSMIPGFEDQLVGVSASDNKSIEVSFPADYSASDLAGKAAIFDITVHSVAEPVLPELNDEFSVSFGMPEGGIEKLRSEVRNNMERELEAALKTSIKQQVFDCLIEKTALDIPTALLDREIDALVKNDQLAADTVTDDVSRASYENEAKRRVSLGLLIGEIAKINQLQLDPDKIRITIENIAASYEKPEEVKQWYYGNQEMMAGIQSLVMEDTVVDWVIGSANINENSTTFSELLK